MQDHENPLFICRSLNMDLGEEVHKVHYLLSEYLLEEPAGAVYLDGIREPLQIEETGGMWVIAKLNGDPMDYMPTLDFTVIHGKYGRTPLCLKYICATGRERTIIRTSIGIGLRLTHTCPIYYHAYKAVQALIEEEVSDHLSYHFHKELDLNELIKPHLRDCSNNPVGIRNYDEVRRVLMRVLEPRLIELEQFMRGLSWQKYTICPGPLSTLSIHMGRDILAVERLEKDLLKPQGD